VQLELGDAAGLRLLAEQASCEQRGKLLRVFADIVASGTSPPWAPGSGQTPRRRLRVGGLLMWSLKEQIKLIQPEGKNEWIQAVPA